MSWLARVVGQLPRPWLKAVGRAQWRHPWLKRLFDWAARRLREGVTPIQQGAGRGLLFAAGRGNAGYVLGTSEPHVQRVLELLLRPGMTVFDVGANVGFFAVIAARLVGPTGRVVCFEPVAQNADAIERSAAANGFTHVTVRREALGARDGRGGFLLSDTPGWGRLDGVGDAPAGASGRIEVPLRRLDSVLRDEGGPPPELLKIDVEGAEADVLAGASEFLAGRHPMLVIELHGTNRDVAGRLDALGYLSLVVGRRTDIRSAPWDAHVVAYRPGDDRLASLAAELERLPVAE